MRTRILTLIGIFMALFSFSKGEPLNVGEQAPAISGTTETGATLNLGDVYKKGLTLVYFYPKADTPGCTAQGCSLRDSYEVLQQKGVTVIGISRDNVAAQAAFKEKYHLPFTLIADTKGEFTHAFGQPDKAFASRQAFLIDREGKVVWRDLQGHTKDQADQVLAELKTLNQNA